MSEDFDQRSIAWYAERLGEQNAELRRLHAVRAKFGEPADLHAEVERLREAVRPHGCPTCGCPTPSKHADDSFCEGCKPPPPETHCGGCGGTGDCPTCGGSGDDLRAD